MLVLLLPVALAKPEAPALFCEAYPDAPACVSGVAPCLTCHVESGPPARNPFGADLSDRVDPEQPFAEQLPPALAAVEALDSDGDGLLNLEEILAGTWPGFDAPVEPECSPQTRFDNKYYTLGEYDHAFAYRRVLLDFCGRSPRYDELTAFRAEADPDAALQDALDACLQSPYWDEVLRELGVGVVRPVGPGTDVNLLGNWNWDLRLFSWAMSGGRDAGEVMTADYLVVEDPPGSGRLAAIPDPRDATEAYAQPLDAEDRYGLITTRYSLAMNVMFAPVPRTLAAHWYRELLGLDIARSEGLYPVDEAQGAWDWPAPLDVDDRGVWQQACAGCHATLDPLSYPWARYNGIDLQGDTTGVLLPDRAVDVLPTTDGAIFGEPISTPAQWVDAAVGSDAFARNTALMFWRYLMRRAPYACEQDQVDALWTTFRDNGRDVEDMLRLFITLDAYGAP